MGILLEIENHTLKIFKQGQRHLTSIVKHEYQREALLSSISHGIKRKTKYTRESCQESLILYRVVTCQVLESDQFVRNIFKIQNMKLFLHNFRH